MIYIYKHPDQEEYREVLQGMNDDHVYFEDDLEWKRVFTIPNMSMDTQIDPYSSKDFVTATANKKGTFGDIMDFKQEIAEKRRDKEGKDPISEKYMTAYEKANGVSHPSRKPKNFENKHVKVEF